MNEAAKQRNIDKLKETNRTRMAEKRREAESAIALMGALYDRVRTDEQKRKGLIIVTALYGKFNPDENVATEQRDDMGFIQHNPNVIDVRIPLQCLVKDSRLTLYGSTKSELPGFFDPCFGEDKMLRIDYEYQTRSFSLTVADNEDIKIPENGSGS